MKILHVFKRSFPQSMGGVEQFIDTLCKSTSEYGIQNNVLSLSTNPSKRIIKLDGYDVHHAKEIFYIGSTGFSIDAYFKFLTLARNSDIIHHHYPHPFGDLLQVSSFIKKPYIVTYHSDILRQIYLEKIYNPLKYYFLNHSRKIIATSPNYYITSQILQKYSKKVEVIPIGIPKELYKVSYKKNLDYWRKILKKEFFLFIGAHRYYKGLKSAIEAIEGTDIQLVFAGTVGPDKELIKFAKSKSIKNVQFLGRVSLEDKCALLKLCYGFVFPSNMRTEAFGIALMEAAYFGKPLISCEIGTGTSYVNEHNNTGFVVKPGSSKDLRMAMQNLLDNKELAKRFGENARKRANRLFCADEQANSYIKIYSDIYKG